jgi:hypothetical protein
MTTHSAPDPGARETCARCDRCAALSDIIARGIVAALQHADVARLAQRGHHEVPTSTDSRGLRRFEAAKTLGISVATFRRLEREGTFKAVHHIGREARFDVETLRAALAVRRPGPIYLARTREDIEDERAIDAGLRKVGLRIARNRGAR